MTYAAWYELHDDDAVVDHPTALRVYARLLRRGAAIFRTPQAVKIWLLAEQMRAHRESVIVALDLLIRRGYVVEHGREMNNVRRITIAKIRAESQAGSQRGRPPKPTPSFVTR